MHRLTEINLSKKKWFLNYSPDKSSISMNLSALRKKLDPYPIQYKNIVLLGDLKVEVDNKYMKNFSQNLQFEKFDPSTKKL